MKHTHGISLVLGVGIFIAYLVGLRYEVFAYGEGIFGESGSPSAQQNCSSCHMVSNEVSNVILSSDIPSNGYMPSQTYRFTLLIKSKNQHAGFDIRPELSSGGAAGTILKTDDENTSVSFSQDEITHNNNIMTGVSKVVQFDWKAPQKGTGMVTFYAAVGTGVSEDTNGVYMDTLNVFNIPYSEDLTTSIADDMIAPIEVFASYNPIYNQVEISHESQNQGASSATLLNSEGRAVQTKYITTPSLTTIPCADLRSGMYVVNVYFNHQRYTRKVFVSK